MFDSGVQEGVPAANGKKAKRRVNFVLGNGSDTSASDREDSRGHLLRRRRSSSPASERICKLNLADAFDVLEGEFQHGRGYRVGRDLQAGKLSAVLKERLTNKKFGVVLLSGPHGSGKSTVLEELLYHSKGLLPPFKAHYLDFKNDEEPLSAFERKFGHILGAESIWKPAKKCDLGSLPLCKEVQELEINVGLFYDPLSDSVVVSSNYQRALETSDLKKLSAFLHLPSQDTRILHVVLSKTTRLRWDKLPQPPGVERPSTDAIMFPPYTKPQLRDIIDDRVARAASKGTDGIFTAVAVGSIAAFAVKHTGARTAMRVCTRAVLECEFRNLSNIRWRSEGPVSPMNCSDVTLAAQFVTILIDKPDSFSDLQDDHLADLPKRFPVQEKKESET